MVIKMKRYKRSSMKHILAAALFCMTLGMGMVCHADEKGTVIVPSAKIRASADTSSEQIGSASEGKTVDIIGQTTGSDGSIWYQVYVDADTKGFIKGDLIRMEGGTDSAANTTTPSAPQDLPETVVTQVEARKAAVKPDKATVRKGAGTSYAKVGTANRGTVVTVIGEATASDGAKWYQISIMHQNTENIGFIRADLVTFDDIPEDVATSQIVGSGNEGGDNPEEQPPETEPQPEPEPEPDPEPQPTPAAQSVTLMDGGELSYVMPGFVAIDMKLNEEKFGAYQNGAFYIIYGRDQAGEEGWFLFDSERQLYQRYAYEVEGVSAGGSALSGGLLPMIALVIVIVILLAIIGLMFLKLREYREDYGDYEDDEEDYSEDDDIEDLEEEEDYYGEEQPARRQRPQRIQRLPEQEQQPVRRPQPPQGNGQQAARRPQQPQSNGQQAARRPQPQPSNGQQQAARRPQQPQQNNGQQQAVRRPQPPQQNNGQPQAAHRPQPQQGNGQQQAARRPQPQQNNGQQAVRRPQPQAGGQAPRQNNRPPQGGQQRPAQQGAKARPILDSEKEDMEFIDI